MNTHLPGSEVVTLLHRAIAGQVTLRLIKPDLSWEKVYCGVVGFQAGDWTIYFFNDCASLDYCDSASAPDGRVGTFDAWSEAGEEPIALLSEAAQRALEDLLYTCT